MLHSMVLMTCMENIAKMFGQVIGWTNDPRNKFHNNTTILSETLNIKVIDIHMTCEFSGRIIIIDNFQSINIINVNCC